MFKSEFRSFLKFVSKLSALTIGVYALLIIANWIAADKTMPYLYQLSRLHHQFQRNEIADLSSIKYLVIGDSTSSRAILPENISPFRSFSIAVPGGSAVEAYYSLKRAYQNGAKPRCVVLMTSYAAYERHQRELFWQQIVPVQMIEPDEILDFYRITRTQGIEPGDSVLPIWAYARAFSIQLFYYANWSKLNEAAFKPYMATTHPRRSYRSFRYSLGASPSSLSSIWQPEPFDGANQQYLKYKFKPLPAIDLYLKRIFELTAAHESKIVVLMPPIGLPLRTPTADNWVQDYQAYMRHLGSTYPHVHNAMQTEWWPRNEFLDGTHVDDIGAVKFTTKFRDTILSCGSKSQVDP